MLKLQKNSTTNQINVRPSERSPLFSKSLITALLIALFLHFTFFFFFRISTKSFAYKNLVLPPISVHADTFDDDSHQTSKIETEAKTLAKRNLFEPSLSKVTIPAISKKTSPLPLTNLNSFDLSFKKTELEYLIHYHSPLEIPITLPKVTIVTSGPLASLELKKNIPLLKESVSAIPGLIQEIRAQYEVLVSQETGKVIWFQAESATTKEQEKLLLELEFKKSKERSFTKGAIEITYAKVKAV